MWTDVALRNGPTEKRAARGARTRTTRVSPNEIRTGQARQAAEMSGLLGARVGSEKRSQCSALDVAEGAVMCELVSGGIP